MGDGCGDGGTKGPTDRGDWSRSLGHSSFVVVSIISCFPATSSEPERELSPVPGFTFSSLPRLNVEAAWIRLRRR